MELVDTHCHLTWDAERFPAEEILQRARAVGVQDFICVAIDVDNALACAELARQHEDVHPTLGIHPNDVGSAEELEVELQRLQQQLAQDSWVALGETGLDFYRDWSDPELQRRSLRRHLELSADTGLPIILHCRQAIESLLEELQAFAAPLRGIMHCYSEGPGAIETLVDMGLHISFAGNLTYPKSVELQEAARRVPLERLLVETDAPFLAPQPKRGKRNEPAHVRHTLEFLAELRAEDACATAAATTRNARELFGLKAGRRGSQPVS